MLLLDDRFPIFLHQLLMGCRTMETGGNENGDIDVGICLANAAQQDRHGHLAGHRARMVAGYDDHTLLPLDQVFQLCAADGVVHGTLDNLLLGALHLCASGIGFQDPKEIVVRNFNGNMGFVIGNLQFHAIHSFII